MNAVAVMSLDGLPGFALAWNGNKLDGKLMERRHKTQAKLLPSLVLLEALEERTGWLVC